MNNNNLPKDLLSWELFKKVSYKHNGKFLNKIGLYNRLICHSKNFFAISGFGAFTNGYMLLITKKLIPSFASLDSKQIKELIWFKNLLTSTLSSVFLSKIALFEHGMCACVGGLNRAHTHLMTLNNSITKDEIKKTINQVLKNRRAGIKSINFRGTKLINLDDIDQVMNLDNQGTYKINGKQFELSDIQNLELSKWPLGAKNHIKSGGHYVYFEIENFGFFTKHNFSTQLGREIVFNLQIKKNKTLFKQNQKILKKNNFANTWRWQEFIFEKNIINTINKSKNYLRKIKKNDFFEKYAFEVL